VDHPPERFARLYDQYYRNILRYALLHADQGSAEDVASEVFLIAWRQLPALPEPPLPWLLGVARNLVRQQADAGRRRRLLASRLTALTTAADLTAWDAGEYVVERESALEVLMSLPERDVEALTLITWHGLSPLEAAAVAGCSPRAFTVRLHRARRRLARALRSADHVPKPPAGRSAPAVAPPGGLVPSPNTPHPMEQA
jgi:RNA polymerase sigma-70 factor, ECF subfamily